MRRSSVAEGMAMDRGASLMTFAPRVPSVPLPWSCAPTKPCAWGGRRARGREVGTPALEEEKR